MVPTMRGLERAIAHAASAGVSTHVMVVRDRADRETVDEVDRLVGFGTVGSAVEVTVLDVDHGDLGLARNAGIAATTAPLVCVLDADNLPSANWLLQAAHALQGAAEPSIVHPQRLVTFGDRLDVCPYEPSDAAGFRPGVLGWFNPWDAFCMAHRAVFEAHPYRELRPGSGFGPEDWAWNCDTVGAGIPHLVVAETTLYYHAKGHGSLAAAHRGSLLPRNAVASDQDVARDELAFLSAPDAPEDPAPRSSAARRAAGRVVRAGRAAAGELLARGRGDEAPPAPDIPWPFRDDTPEMVDDWWEAQRLQTLLHAPVPDNLARYQVWGDAWDSINVPDRRAFWTLIATLPQDLDMLFIAPWVMTGGADTVLLEHVRAVRRLRPDAAIGLVTTEPVTSNRLADVPDGVTVVDLGAFALWPEFAAAVLAKACVQLRPQTIHIVNSVAGWDMVERFGAAVGAHSTLFASTFVVDVLADGATWSFLHNRSRDTLGRFARILTDNHAFVDRVVEEQGVPRELFAVSLVAPGDLITRPERPSPGPLRLLWVGRFDRQKRLDRLADVCEALVNDGQDVEVTVIGEPLIDRGDEWRVHLDRVLSAGGRRGAAYVGGLAQARIEQYDALLMTSDWEGVPSVLLEALAAGLPVVAPTVGDIGTVLSSDTGYPVDPEGGVAAYVEAIRELGADDVQARERAGRARALVDAEHSRDALDRRLARLTGYLPRRGGDRLPPLRFWATPDTARALEEQGADVLVYTGSAGFSNFGDVLQNKNVLAYWDGREGRTTTLLMPLHAAHPGGRAERLAQWYPADRIVFFSEDAVLARGAGLVEVDPPSDGSLVHVVGGGYLNGLWGHLHFPVIDAVATWAQAPVLFSGLQVDRAAMPGFERIARHHRIVCLGLRDHASFDLARDALPDLPVTFTFDDLTEVLQDWARAAVDRPRAPGPMRVAIHMNTSDYAGGDGALDHWRGVLATVHEAHPGAELLVLHAYADGRTQVRDALDTVCALAEDMPFSSFGVVDIAKASLEYRSGDGLPPALEPLLDVDMVLSSSYHTALLGAFLRKPAYLMGVSSYFQQKAQLFRLPALAEFLDRPQDSILDIPEEVEARSAWLRQLGTLPEALED